MTAPAPVPDGTTPPASWRCRRGWHGRSEIGMQGLAVLCIVHRCPRCGIVWREQVTP